MLEVVQPLIRTTTLDFSSSGQGKCQVSQLWTDDILLTNAIELVDWGAEQTQLLICESCGVPGCKSGDWVSLRRVGPLILILPTFGVYAANERGNAEHGPPDYVRKMGIPWMALSTYESLRNQRPSLLSIDRIPELTMREAVLAFQWDAPLQIFGRPPDQVLRRDGIVTGSSDGEYIEHLRRIEEFARSQISNGSRVTLKELTNAERVISLYLDGPEFVEWKALAYSGSGEMQVVLDSRYIVVPESAP